MKKEECSIGQRVRIKTLFQHDRRFDGLIGTIKELPLGFVVVEIDVPLLTGEIEPVEEPKTFEYPIGLPREFGEFVE